VTISRAKQKQKFLLLLTASVLGLQVGWTTPSDAISLNNNVASDTPAAANIFDHTNQYSNVVSVNGCTGTLINSRTILTAAHCFYDTKTDRLKPDLPIDIRFGPDANVATRYDQTAIGLAVAPGYTFNGTESDIAVVTLNTPVTGASIAPVVLVGPNDPRPPPGSLMVTVGYGQYGTGLDGLLYSTPAAAGGAPSNYRRRVGETRLGDYVLWHYDGRTPGPHGIYAAQFRDPNSPDVHDAYQLTAKGFDVPAHQAGNGAGDSGGPLFLVLPDGSLVQVGVLALLVPATDGTIRYGSISGWAAVQDYQGWLDTINPLRQVSARQGNVAWSDKTTWSEGEVPDNQAGAMDEPYGLAGRFFDVRLFEPGRVSLDMNATIDTLSVFGAQTVFDVTAGHTLQAIAGAGMWSGQILLNGTLATPYLDMHGGVLSGTGLLSIIDYGVQDLGFGLFNLAGTVAPGNATQTGVLTVAGDYVQGRHGSLSVRLGDGNSDRLAVTGHATLAGNVAMSALGPVVLNTAYPILTAGSLSGGFDAVLANFAFLDTSLAYSGVDVSAWLSRNTVAFADVAQTFNQAAAATAFETLDPSRSLYRNVLGLSAPEARYAFDLGSGEIHASVKSVLIDDSRHLRDAANTRLREAPPPPSFKLPNFKMAFNSIGETPAFTLPASTERFAMWGHTYGSSGHVDADGNAARVDRRSNGVLIGGDAPLDETWRVGALAGYNQTSFNINARRSSGTSDNFHFGLYGGGDFGATFVRSGAFYSGHDIRTSRTVALASFVDQAQAAYNANTVQAFAEAGYRWKHLTTSVEPYLNLAHVRLTTNAFAEQAQDIALRAASQTTGVTFTTTGVRGSTDFSIASNRMTVSAGAGWRRAFGERLPLSTLGLSSADFTVAGTAIAQDAAVIDANVTMFPADNAALSLAYNGQLASSAAEHTVTARLKIAF
jgi:outer membrane autotransporter protein